MEDGREPLEWIRIKYSQRMIVSMCDSQETRHGHVHCSFEDGMSVISITASLASMIGVAKSFRASFALPWVSPTWVSHTVRRWCASTTADALACYIVRSSYQITLHWISDARVGKRNPANQILMVFSTRPIA